jgi:hypothetical protein
MRVAVAIRTLRRLAWSCLAAALVIVGVSVSVAAQTAAPSTAPSAYRDWSEALRRLTLASKLGASVSAGRLLGALPAWTAQPVATVVVVDPASGLIRACFGPCNRMGNRVIILSGRDLKAPDGAARGQVREPSIGLTLSQLLARLRKNPNFAGKTLLTGPGGEVLMVQATEQDPPPAVYDHGLQATTFDDYVVRNGVVVARGYTLTEN